MKRGEVWWVNFDPSVGGEAQKTRPAVVVSNNVSNRHLNRIQVIPITSNVDRFFAGEARVTVRGELRKAQANLLTTVSKARVSSMLDTLTNQDLTMVENALKEQLGL